MKEIHVDKVNLLVIDELISTSDNQHQWFSILSVFWNIPTTHHKS